jgi:hypothetical protein
MKELVEYLVKALVDKPEEVNITQTQGRQDRERDKDGGQGGRCQEQEKSDRGNNDAGKGVSLWQRNRSS